MRNNEVVEAFLRKERAVNSTGSLSSTGTKLFSYATCIAQWYRGFLIVNYTKYSVTSSTHRNYLRNHKQDYHVVEVPKEEKDLVKYLRNFNYFYGN